MVCLVAEFTSKLESVYRTVIAGRVVQVEYPWKKIYQEWNTILENIINAKRSSQRENNIQKLLIIDRKVTLENVANTAWKIVLLDGSNPLTKQRR